jgi:hypothetical protein
VRQSKATYFAVVLVVPNWQQETRNEAYELVQDLESGIVPERGQWCVLRRCRTDLSSTWMVYVKEYVLQVVA